MAGKPMSHCISINGSEVCTEQRLATKIRENVNMIAD